MSANEKSHYLSFIRLDDFSVGISHLTGKFTVTVCHGGSDGVEIICGEKEFKKLKIKTTDNSAEISTGAFAAVTGDLTILVSAALSKLSVAGSAALEVTRLADCAKVSLAGSVNADIAVITDELKLSLAGSNKVTLALEANSLTLSSAGSCKADISGEAANAVYSAGGSAEISAATFVCQTCKIRSSGLSKFTVHADKNLNIKASGSGQIVYFGDALVNCSSAGSVRVSRGEGETL